MGLLTSVLSACEPQTANEPLLSETPAAALTVEHGEPRLRAGWQPIAEELSAIRQLELDHWLPNVMYAGSQGGIFVSWSFGERWTAAQLPAEALGVVADPNRPGSALAYSEHQLFETHDAGLHWRKHGGQLPGNLLAIAPGDPNTLWAARSPLFFKSSDRGASWSRLDFGGPGSCCLEFVALSSSQLYAAANYAQLQRSFDGGASWPLSTFASLYMVGSFAVERDHPDLIYAGNYLPYGPTGLRKSTDGGRTWSVPSERLASAQVRDVALAASGTPLYVVTTSDSGPATLHVSTDGGNTFDSAFDHPFADARSVRIVPHPNWHCLAYALSDGALYRTIDGGGSCP